MRINARLDDESEQHFRYLQKITGQNCTEIVKKSLALYYRQINADAKHRNQQLLEELSGIASGSSDGSVNYKQVVKDYLERK